jgi:hypothetical protein
MQLETDSHIAVTAGGVRMHVVCPKRSARSGGVLRFGPPDPDPLWLDNNDASVKVLE